ncbi:Sulfate transporter 4.1, chloroplastic [Cocos nucifera]|uniref:Sulfate transporter 4.1, chloroplastic n=1 Tax=Cocos nucifera TaxID=13894 RepID=A0A8K0I4Q2_COCNU|nr:Sulfate transporter 4.1, chloroplastic [Cocos nucifera]
METDSDATAPARKNSFGGRTVKVIPFQHASTSSSPPPQQPSATLVARWGAKLRAMTAVEWIELFLPCSRWIRTYRWREYLQVDLMSGLTVGVMLVPQVKQSLSPSSSSLSTPFLLRIFGSRKHFLEIFLLGKKVLINPFLSFPVSCKCLDSGFVPIFIYALFGSSRQLAIGPVALVSLLVSNVLSQIVEPSNELYTELAILLALMVGILECLMGLLSFKDPSGDCWKGQFSWPPFVMGSIFLAVLLLMKHLGKSKKHLRWLRAAGPLTAVVLGTTFVKLFHPSSISVVGEIPQGLPKFSIPRGFQHVKSLLSTAALITGVAILESVGIAKALAAKNGYELDSNQELFGLGVANICGSFFSSYPITGSFSRSAVNHESGAKTGLSGITMGIIMGCALLFMTPLFSQIPQCALAAIVISAVMGLVDYKEALFLWRVDKKDFLLWTITCITTLVFGIEIGVIVGVGFSLAFVIHESANPHIAVLGRLPGTTVYRNILQYPEAYTYNGIVVVRIDAPIYFANISYIKDRLREYEHNLSGTVNRGPDVGRIYFVILEMSRHGIQPTQFSKFSHENSIPIQSKYCLKSLLAIEASDTWYMRSHTRAVRWHEVCSFKIEQAYSVTEEKFDECSKIRIADQWF